MAWWLAMGVPNVMRCRAYETAARKGGLGDAHRPRRNVDTARFQPTHHLAEASPLDTADQAFLAYPAVLEQ